MIASLRGKALAVDGEKVLLEVAGVGFEVQVPLSSAAALKPNQELFVHTRLIVGESSRALYGFERLEERELFDLLLPIKGVGPRLVLNLMSGGVDGLIAALRGGDMASLTALPGVGKRLAERLIMETRAIERLGEFAPSAGAGGAGGRRDAEQALVALGYAEREAAHALAAAFEAEAFAADADSSTMVRAALKHLGSAAK